MDANPTLVIGDVHGHFDRLEALLKQENILDTCPACEGTGDPTDDQILIYEAVLCDAPKFCTVCSGDGIARVNKNVEVVQLGDLGHFGSERGDPNMYGSAQTMVPGSTTGDLLCYEAAVNKGWIDVMLWGNHDRAVVDSQHEFGGYIKPPRETIRIMEEAHRKHKLRLAHVAHGYLLTHAGLHAAFKNQKDVADVVKEDPQAFADWINDLDREELDLADGPRANAIRDCIGKLRGGRSDYGGILWRDSEERLYDPFKQIFGHTAKDKVRKYKENKDADWSWCIDIGQPNNGQLAGVWLPDLEFVYVNTNIRQLGGEDSSWSPS